MDMIERVAKAICASTNIAMVGVTEVILDDPDYVIPAHKRTNGKPLARWQLYVPQARAAIEAMREPTDAMCEAAATVDRYAEPGDEWGPMIDAALSSAVP